MKHALFAISLLFTSLASAQDNVHTADSLKAEGDLMNALEHYGMAFMESPESPIAYRIAATCALLWTRQMRDTAFYFLNIGLQQDSSLEVLYEPEMMSLIEDPKWTGIEENQIRKYEAKNGIIPNAYYARQLFRMIIRDQGFMYAGNIERRKYLLNGGRFETPAIFPVLAMEERNLQDNETRLLQLLDTFGWPKTSQVTEYAAAGAALIINHGSHALRAKYFPMLEKAFQEGEAQPLRYAKMKDRLLVEEDQKQLYGTQIRFDELQKVPYPIADPELVDQRRASIGLGPLAPYLKERFGIEWKPGK